MLSPEQEYWKTSIQEKFATLKESRTWKKYLQRPSEILASGNIFKLSRDELGRPARFKARIVAPGNFQKGTGKSYAELYAPFACFELVRSLLTLSLAQKRNRRHLDIKGAFLYASIPDNMNL